jgi:hypothetical protein
MLGGSKRHGAGVLVMFAVLALVVGACSGSSGSATPGSATPGATDAQTGGPADTGGPAATGDQGGTSLSGAAANLSGVTSYKFTMTLAGGSFASLLAMFGDSGSDNAPFTVSGTVVTSPEAGADVKLAGRHVIEIGGADYLDMGDGTYTKTTATGLVSGLSPQTLYASVIDSSADSGYSLVGTGDKNGVQADHYQASSAYLVEYGSILGVANATWTGDVWIARTGGYPVSIAILAKAADKSVAYEMSFDLTSINDPANKVAAPENVAGA